MAAFFLFFFQKMVSFRCDIWQSVFVLILNQLKTKLLKNKKKFHQMWVAYLEKCYFCNTKTVR